MSRRFTKLSETLMKRRAPLLVASAAATSACGGGGGGVTEDEETSDATTSESGPTNRPSRPMPPQRPVREPETDPSTDDQPPPPPPAEEEPTVTDPEPETPPADETTADDNDPVAEDPAPEEETEETAETEEPDPTTDPVDEGPGTVDGDGTDGDSDDNDPVAEDPAPEEETEETAETEEPDPTTDPIDEGPGTVDGDGTDGGSDNTPPPEEPDTSLSIVETASVMGGRVTTFDLEGDVASVRILDWPDVGNLTINPDNTVALILSGTNYQGPLDFSIEVTYADNTTATITKSLTVEPLQQTAGWGAGDHYMLETDEGGNLIVETGDNHRVVHISGSEDALSLADIAAIEGLAVTQITQAWLVQNGQYGSTPELALDLEAGGRLWGGLVGKSDEPGSHWLLFERGYEYANGRFLPEGTTGESELHPIYVGAYGEGSPPLMLNQLKLTQTPIENVVIDSLAFEGGVDIFNGTNIIMNNVTFTDDPLNVFSGSGITIRNSSFYDITDDAPSGEDTWWAHADRKHGFFSQGSENLLLEGNFFDMIGWEQGYDFNRSADFGQPPSQYNQNVYIQRNNLDVTFRDNISMRAASFGAQIRPGGFIEDNVFLDNNAGVNFLGGSANGDGTMSGNYTLFADNLITSAAAKRVDDSEGARTLGLADRGQMSSLVDNIITHLADPNNPEDIENKLSTHAAIDGGQNAYYNDTIIYNWVASNDNPDSSRFRSPDTNIEGLNTAQLDQTTIQRFTADLLGVETATIDDFAQYMRANMSNGTLSPVDADMIIAYFQQTFGIAPDVRTEAETLRFVPDDRGDGFRWDNRLNWTTDDLPGQVSGDSVDLGGNWVSYAAMTSTINDLDFGSGGKLAVTSGVLRVTGDTTVGARGGEIDVSKAGQLWMNGYADNDRLDIDVMGGRFANLGDFSGNFDFTVSDGQAILAASGATMQIGEDSRLTIIGDEGRIGFDGADGGIATLHMNGGRLDFIADASGFGTITEFRSGAFGDEPNVLSGIDLGDGVLGIDITALNGAAIEDVLLGADEILGSFSTIELIGLREDQDAIITFDYETDEVTFRVTAAGDGIGQFNVEFLGDMMDAQNSGDLWAALTNGQGTYSETDPPDLDEVEEFTSLVA